MRTYKITRPLTLIFCISAFFATTPSDVSASCAPDASIGETPAPATAVVCIGETINQDAGPGYTNGYGTQTQNGLTISVHREATVTGSGASFAAGIYVHHNNTIKNSGTIFGENAGVILNTGTVYNSGLIVGKNVGIATDNYDTSAIQVINSGKITGTNAGVVAGALTLKNYGTIQAIRSGVGNSAAVSVDRAAHITNFGTLSGGNFGIVITPSSLYPIYGAGQIRNYGSIVGTTAGLALDGYINRHSIINRGDITGGIHGVSATNADIVNSGTISGGIVGLSGSYSSLVNSGIISGGHIGLGIEIGDKLTNTGVISGHFQSIELSNGGQIDNYGVLLGDVRNVNRFGRPAQIRNFGFFSGSADIKGRDNFFSNLEAGVVYSGSRFDLGVNGSFETSGTISPGGPGQVTTTAVVGRFVQKANGAYHVDVGSASNDRLVVSGSAKFAGSVAPRLLSVDHLGKAIEISTATGGIIDDGVTAIDTAAVDYGLVFPDAQSMSLTAKIDFKLAGASENQASMASSLNDLVGSSETLGFLVPLANLATSSELAKAFGQLAPATVNGLISSTVSTVAIFGGQLLSCHSLGEVGDANAVIHEGQCLWARASVRDAKRDGGYQTVGHEETATFVSGGAQFDVGGPWRLGVGAGLENTELKTTQNATVGGDRLHIGAVLKYNLGPWLVAVGLSGGHGWYETERNVSFGDFSAFANSDTESSFIAGRFTAAYLASFGTLYLKPQIELSATNIQSDGYTESGSGGIALRVASSDEVIWSLSPTIELGAKFLASSEGIARPYLKGGLTWIDEGDLQTSASFADASADSVPFAYNSELDRVSAVVGAGVELIDPSGLLLRLQYDGQIGSEFSQHIGSAKLSYPF